MAKLYWRLKHNGKWTWKAVRVDDPFTKTLIDRLSIQDGIYQEAKE